MGKKDDDLGFWAGWFVAFGIAAVFFIYTVLQAPTLRGLACAPDEQNCYREWVSALGGWTAIVVAVPTIIYLARQIRDADRHHRKSAALNLRRLRALAVNIEQNSKVSSGIAYTYMVFFSGSKGNSAIRLNKCTDIIRILNGALDLFADRNYEAFETEIYLPMDHATFLRAQLEKIRTEVDEAPEMFDGVQAQEIAQKLHEFHALVKNYMDDIALNAARFLRDTSDYASLRD